MHTVLKVVGVEMELKVWGSLVCERVGGGKSGSGLGELGQGNGGKVVGGIGGRFER